MFDLEQSISVWRKQMLAAGIKTPVPLEELENHLREEIEQQMKLGLSAQTAFPIAVEKIGQGNLIKAEFKKIGGMDKMQLRKKTSYFYTAILCVYSLAMTYAMSKNDLSIKEWLLGFVSLATLFASSYFVWRIAPRFFPAIASRRVQSMVGIIGGISGAIWFIAFANLILSHFDFTQGQLMVAISWAMVPTLVLPNLAFLIIDKNENQSTAANGL